MIDTFIWKPEGKNQKDLCLKRNECCNLLFKEY